jgi:hypothetical protein
MFRYLLLALLPLLSCAQGSTGNGPLIFTDTTRLTPVGNYTLGYVNNTVENRCHIGAAKFQAAQTGIVDSMTIGVYSRPAQETCGISFVLRTFPALAQVGSSVLTTITDLVAAKPGTDELIPFNVNTSLWGVVSGHNYTILIQPFSWQTPPPPLAGVPPPPPQHCVFDVPYGRPGIPYFFLGEHGPTAQPCGATPYTIDLGGDGLAMQLSLAGHPAAVTDPSPSPSITPTPTSTHSPSPTPTGTPTPSATPTGTPTITDTPTPTLSPGASVSNSATSSRTPSRTPSISYTPTATSSVTPSVTATPTPSPTPTLRIGASPSVTPTETPGPTDSSSPKPIAAVGITGQAAQPAAPVSAGSIIGAAIGGALAVVGIIALAIRFRIVSAQLNDTPRLASWRQTTKKTTIGEEAVIVEPSPIHRVQMMMRNPVSTRAS